MYIILSLLLLLPTQALAEDHYSMADYCNEIAAVLQESVRDGTLTYREAGAILGNCFQTEEW